MVRLTQTKTVFSMRKEQFEKLETDNSPQGRRYWKQWNLFVFGNAKLAEKYKKEILENYSKKFKYGIINQVPYFDAIQKRFIVRNFRWN